ncbi:MAG: leucine-rich repeat protein, partial [Butyrivibrio sp.]|nr:leucine-rich repeat protein [Butyrivibrio sp.]
AFKGCKKLSKITIKNPSISKIGKQAFKNISSKATVTIKTSSKKTYKKIVKLLKKAGASNAAFKNKK